MHPLKHPFTALGIAVTVAASLASPAHAQKTHQFDGGGATIPAVNSFGPASVYPLTVAVSGVNAPIGEVKVQLTGVSHTYVIDLEVLLVSPDGRTVHLMNRVGGASVAGVEYLFVDGAPAMPNNDSIGSGRFAPSQRPFAPVIPAPAPAGPYGATLSVFDGAIANGTWSLYINDAAGGDVGAMTGWSLQITEADSVHNPAPISIPDLGPASIYPSGITVDGVEGPVESVSVMLPSVSHTWPADMRMLLVGPGGQTCLLYGRCGDNTGIVNGTLIIDDNAPGNLPSGPLVSGAFRPTACYGTAGQAFNAPAPAPPYGATLSVFNGLPANGRWRLFIDDAAAPDGGSLASGWILSVNGQGFCGPDYNKSGEVSVQDIYDFLADWNAGCP